MNYRGWRITRGSETKEGTRPWVAVKGGTALVDWPLEALEARLNTRKDELLARRIR